jgi:hypothetical protein
LPPASSARSILVHADYRNFRQTAIWLNLGIGKPLQDFSKKRHFFSDSGNKLPNQLKIKEN